MQAPGDDGLADVLAGGVAHGDLVAASDAEPLGVLVREHDAGRALVEREFSWDAVAERTVALYRTLARS